MFIPSADDLPPGFVQNIEGAFGAAGVAWLKRLPSLLRSLARRWGLDLGPPFGLSYNYAAPSLRRDGTHVVLKAGVPCRELTTEVAALSSYAGRGCARLLDHLPASGALLLEHLTPGEMLSTVPNDEAATRIAAGVMREIRRAPLPGHVFPTVADWAGGMTRFRAHYHGGTGPIPRRLVEEAEALFADLLASQGEPVLLHGDLHHFNILRDGGGWRAIDPKGIVGEAEYEIGAFLRNPDPQLLARPDAVCLQRRRIEVFSEELGFDRMRLRDWAVAQAVLSGWWAVEDGGSLSEVWIACMERLAEVRF